MPLYRLLASQHYQADPDWKPSEEDKFIFEKTGRKPRAPSKKYVAGDVVDSNIDLVARFGAEKFAAVTPKERRGRKTEDEVPEAELPTYTTPGGQVVQGHQMTAGGVTGAVTGPDTDEARQLTPRAVEAGKAGKPAKQEEPKEKWTKHDLSQMTVVELKDLAREEQIDLAGAHTKDEIVSAVLKGQK